jgi:pilus assembly protein Flp/PilA
VDNGTTWCLRENKPKLCEQKNQKNKKTNMEERKMERIRNFFKDESGVTTVEYGLMVALMAVALIGAIGYLKAGVATTFNDAADKMTGS